MNRIQSLLDSGFATAEPAPSSIETGLFRTSGSGPRHALFVPLHYEPNYAYPLIVWLHGPGDDERQLKRIMPMISMRNYVAVAPRATLGPADGSDRGGYHWCQTDEQIVLAEHRVFAAIRAVEAEFNISPRRIFLGGYQCGGTMAFRLGLSHPDRFAGALSIGGAFPEGSTPLGRLLESRKLRLFLTSARDGVQYPPQKVCENLRLIYAAGMSVNLRQYPCGDELTSHMLSDMDRWIMEQITSPGSALADNVGEQSRKG